MGELTAGSVGRAVATPPATVSENEAALAASVHPLVVLMKLFELKVLTLSEAAAAIRRLDAGQRQ